MCPPDAFYAGGGIGLGPAPSLAEPADPYPTPLVSSRDSQDGPVKRAVADMVKLAQACRWTVSTTYARGWVPHAKLGTPSTEPRDSVAVRMFRGDQRAVAVYVDHGSSWGWDTLYRWRVGVFPHKDVAVTPFLDALFGTPQGTTAWHAPWIRPW